MKIVCYGDSNTYGFDPRGFFADRYPEENTWPAILGKILDAETVNDGMNGREFPRACTEYAHWEYTRLFQVIRTENADLLIIMLGSNDAFQGADIEEISKRCEILLSRVIEEFPFLQILLLAPVPVQGNVFPGDAVTRQIGSAFKQIAKVMGVHFGDSSEWNIELCFDEVHYTENGHRSFAEHTADIIKEFI